MRGLKNLKVCHLTSVHRDGDIRIFHKQCVSLAQAGYDVSLIIPNTESRTEKGVEIVSFESVYKSRRERMTKTVNQVLEKALEIDADIYHFHDPELLKVVKTLKRKGKKVIYDVHEDLPRQILAKHWIPTILRKAISFVTEKYENRKAKLCDGVITATPFIRDRFLKVNKNTLDVNNYPILTELLLDIDYSDKTEDAICYVGGITRVRGIIELLNSLMSLDVYLLLAGTFLEEGLKNECEKLSSWSKVEELGFLNRQEVKDVYLKSKIGIVTLHPIINYLDSLPVKMFEYMAAGLPVIASDFPFWKSIVEENDCGLCVDPLDPKTLAEGIAFLLNNPEEAKRMGENGKKMVKEKYNWNIEETKLVSFYRKIMEA
jgi:glycosyltransferase involved in cell wall biosynthesis